MQNFKYYAIFLSIYYFYIHDVHKDLIEFLFNRNRYYPRNSSIYIRVQFRHHCSLKLVKKKKKKEKKKRCSCMLTQRENLHIHVAGITLNLFEIILSVTRKSLIVPLIAKVIEPAL